MYNYIHPLNDIQSSLLLPLFYLWCQGLLYQMIGDLLWFTSVCLGCSMRLTSCQSNVWCEDLKPVFNFVWFGVGSEPVVQKMSCLLTAWKPLPCECSAVLTGIPSSETLKLLLSLPWDSLSVFACCHVWPYLGPVWEDGWVKIGHTATQCVSKLTPNPVWQQHDLMAEVVHLDSVGQSRVGSTYCDCLWCVSICK